MKIQAIEINHVLGVKQVKVATPSPVTLFTGGNKQGKSSIAESIRMVFGADPVRVKYKKQYGELVNDEAKKGRALVEADNGDQHMIELPSGKTSGDFSKDFALPFVLDPELIARMDEKQRRAFFFQLSGVAIKPKDVADKLKARGRQEELIKRVVPMLTGGFPGAAEYAAKQGTEAKGAWRELTGETYGAEKADVWEPLAPVQVDEKALAEAEGKLADLEKQRDALQQSMGALNSAHAQYQKSLQDYEQNKVLAGKVDSWAAQLEQQTKERDELAKKLELAQALAQNKPRSGLVHDLAVALNLFVSEVGDMASKEAAAAAEAALSSYVGQHGQIDTESDPAAAAEAARNLPKLEESYSMMVRAVANCEKQLAMAKSAAEQGLTLPSEPASKDEIAQQLSSIDAQISAHADSMADMQAAKKQAAENETLKKRADDLHQQVLNWIEIAKDLAPAGIPSEYLGQAIGPVNSRLEQSQADTGWSLCKVDEDMNFRYGGRVYELLSESEKWRTQVMLAEAIAHISGLRMFIADRFDVLEPSARSQFLGWLDTLAVEGDIDSVIALGTLANAPKGLTDSFNSFTVQDGLIV